MRAIISPAKKLDFECAMPANVVGTQPLLLTQANALAKVAKTLATEDLKSLMHISDTLAELNVRRFQAFSAHPLLDDVRPAVFAFRGDTYRGLDVDTLSSDDLAYAQDHLGILSGLYGFLRPLDLMQAYRLEMGTKLKTAAGTSLYDFWGDNVSKTINATMPGMVVNLASNEYMKAVDVKVLVAPVVTCVFKEIKNGAPPKVIGLFAKKARGMMARFMIQNRLKSPEGLKDFTGDGYTFRPALSAEDTYVFTRKI